MPLPELVQRNAEQLLATFCAERTTCHCPHGVQLVYRIRGERATLFRRQQTEGGRRTTAIACFRFSSELQQWSLHYPGADRRWRLYLNASPSLHLGKLLSALDADPFGFFWE